MLGPNLEREKNKTGHLKEGCRNRKNSWTKIREITLPNNHS